MPNKHTTLTWNKELKCYCDDAGNVWSKDYTRAIELFEALRFVRPFFDEDVKDKPSSADCIKRIDKALK